MSLRIPIKQGSSKKGHPSGFRRKIWGEVRGMIYEFHLSHCTYQKQNLFRTSFITKILGT